VLLTDGVNDLEVNFFQALQMPIPTVSPKRFNNPANSRGGSAKDVILPGARLLADICVQVASQGGQVF
jgi:hypothetical protein